MAENESQRIQNLKNKIRSFNEIVKEMPKDKLNAIDGCYFTTSELRQNSKSIMVKMNYKNEANADSSVSLTINVNELFKMPANDVVKELYKIAAKSGMSNENSEKLNKFKAELIIAVKANEIMNARRNAGKADTLLPNELSKNLIFILPDEKIEAIVNGTMNSGELEALINGELDAHSFKPDIATDKKAAEKKEELKQEAEEKGDKERLAELDRSKEDFVKALKAGDPAAQAEAQKYIDGNIYDRSNFVNGTLTKDNNLKDSFNTLKNNLHDRAALEAFSKAFSESFMKAQGLPAVPVRVVNNPQDKGTMGEYYDLGGSHYIEINQAGITDITEFTATLAHELTHAVDASLNKIQGKDGIQNSMPFDVTDNSASGADKAKAEKLLRDLNYKCYQTDPCEQTARNGEQIGLDFVRAVGGKEFDAEIARYKANDEKTQSRVDNVRENLEQIIRDAKNQLSSLRVDASTRAKIEERIKYLEERKNEKTNEDSKYYGNRDRKNMAGAKGKTAEELAAEAEREM